MLAFLSCECMCFRARVLGAPCDPTHAFVANRFLLIKPDCNKHDSNQNTITAFREMRIVNGFLIYMCLDVYNFIIL